MTVGAGDDPEDDELASDDAEAEALIADYTRPLLKAAGLGSVPGTAAEILVPEIRAVLCPDKVTVDPCR